MNDSISLYMPLWNRPSRDYLAYHRKEYDFDAV